jgi:hypothetical protein
MMANFHYLLSEQERQYGLSRVADVEKINAFPVSAISCAANCEPPLFRFHCLCSSKNITKAAQLHQTHYIPPTLSAPWMLYV